MCDEKFKIRVVLLFLWKKGLNANQATNEICVVKCDGTTSKRTGACGFKRFNDGDTISKTNHIPVSHQRSLRQPCALHWKKSQAPIPVNCLQCLAYLIALLLVTFAQLTMSTKANDRITMIWPLHKPRNRSLFAKNCCSCPLEIVYGKEL